MIEQMQHYLQPPEPTDRPNIAIVLTPLGQFRGPGRSFKVVVPKDAGDDQILRALQRTAKRHSKWYRRLWRGFKYDEILFGSRNIYPTDEPVTWWA